jgi:hypothetical protein
MRYNKESLDLALDTLLPEIKSAKDNGCKFTRPELLKMVAMDYFIKDENIKVSFFNSTCYHVCQEALRDLNIIGNFEFGSDDIHNHL